MFKDEKGVGCLVVIETSPVILSKVENVGDLGSASRDICTSGFDKAASCLLAKSIFDRWFSDVDGCCVVGVNVLSCLWASGVGEI
jgi:hypothetical protein